MDLHSEHNAATTATSSLALTTAQGTVSLTPPRSPAATSTSASAEASRDQVKKRKTAQNTVRRWEPPDLGNVGCCITSTYGQTLQDESHVSAALNLLKMEDWMISTTAQQLRLALSTKFEVEARASSEDKLAHLAVIKNQIRLIQRGEAKIHEKYLSDEYLLKYWDEAQGVVVRVMFWDPKDAPNYKSVMTRLAGLEDLATDLYHSLMNIKSNRLSSDVILALQRKWRVYDDMIDGFHREAGTTRFSSDWTHVRNIVFDYIGKPKLPAKRQSKQQTIAMLWVNFALMTTFSISFLGVGFFYSSGAVGRWRDPGFWFLLQGTAVQLGGLFITAISFEKASGYDWAAGGAAAIFTLIAPLLYLKAPSQYSTLTSAVGGIFQALLIQQRSVCDLVEGT